MQAFPDRVRIANSIRLIVYVILPWELRVIRAIAW